MAENYVVEIEADTWECGDGCCSETTYTIAVWEDKKHNAQKLYEWEEDTFGVADEFYNPNIEQIIAYVNRKSGKELLNEDNCSFRQLNY